MGQVILGFDKKYGFVKELDIMQNFMKQIFYIFKKFKLILRLDM